MGYILSILAGCAPLLHSWSKNRDAPLLERVADVAKEITGTHELSQCAAILADNPDMLCRFQQHVADLEMERQRLLVDDRNSARQRDIVMVQNGHTNYRANIMVLSAAIGLLSCLLAITYFAKQMPGEAVGIVSTVAGIFGSCLKDAYTFEFGSSRGSKEKDSTVAALLDRSHKE